MMGPANPVDIVSRVVADGVRRGELRPLDPMLAAALVMGPVIQAATFRTYGRLTGLFPISQMRLSAEFGQRAQSKETDR